MKIILDKRKKKNGNFRHYVLTIFQKESRAKFYRVKTFLELPSKTALQPPSKQLK